MSFEDNEDSWGNKDFADNSQNNGSRNRTKKPKGRPRADKVLKFGLMRKRLH